MSLAGKTIVVTRDASQAKPFINLLKDKEANVFLFPTIRLTDADNTGNIYEVANRITNFDWIIFTSAIAIRFFMKYIKYNYLQNIKIACVGAKTADELKLYKLSANLIPKEFSSKQLLSEMQNFDLKNKQILIPCSSLSNNELKSSFENKGVKVEQIVVYNNKPFDNPNKIELQNKIKNNEIDCITFFSPSAVNAFINIIEQKITDLIRNQNLPIAVIGSTTEKAVIKNRLNMTIKPIISDNENMVNAILNYFSNLKNKNKN